MELNIFSAIAQATVLAQLVLVILLVMSIASWAIIFYKFVALRAAHRKAISGLERFTNAKNLRDAVQSLGGDSSSPLFHIAQQGVAEFNRLRESGSAGTIVSDNVRRSLRQGVSESITALSQSLAFLASASNTAPFIGLFGTVWGIMVAFHRIGLEGSASLATVAPGISEALIATAMGLFVAVPATVGYNMFLNKLQDIEAELVNFAGVFLNRIQRELSARPGAAPLVTER